VAENNRESGVYGHAREGEYIMQKMLWNEGPETLLLERLFGDVTSLNDEELDLLYTSIASRSDGRAASREVTSQPLHRHRTKSNEEVRQQGTLNLRADRQERPGKQCQSAVGTKRRDASENRPRAAKKTDNSERAAIYDARVSRLLSRRKH